MFNLLPESEKKRILKEYRLRKTTIILSFLFATGLISFIFLIPSYMLSSSRDKEVSNRIDAVRRSTIVGEANEINASLVDTNLKIQSLKIEENEVLIKDLFDRVLSKKTDSIRIVDIQFRKKQTDGNEIELSGIARDRESLSAFIKSLEEEDLFLNVDIPVSSFAKETNANFSVNITGKF